MKTSSGPQGRRPMVSPLQLHELQGFTLVELMVTLAIFAVLMGIAVPSFQEMSLNARLRSYTNNLAASVQLARSEAIKRNAVVTLCTSTDGASCDDGDWQQGWIVLASDDTVLHVQGALHGDYVVTANKDGADTNVDELDFPASGVGLTLQPSDESAPAKFRICRASTSAGEPEREVRVSVTGRTSVKTIPSSESACSGS